MLLPGQVIRVFDTITGEIITETSNPDAGVYMGKRRKHPGGFVIVYESEFRQAALLLKDYGAIPICLWNILMTKVKIGSGEILVNTVELAEMLKTHRPNISRGIKTLTELHLISQIKKDGKHFIYKINPSIMWKGKESERQELFKVEKRADKSLFPVLNV